MVRITLREGVLLRGRLVAEKGVGFPDVVLCVRAGGVARPQGRSGERGSFVLLLDPEATPHVDRFASTTTPEGNLLVAALERVPVSAGEVELVLKVPK